jgi:hypothetical protein
MQMHFVFLDPKFHFTSSAITVHISILGALAFETRHDESGVGIFFTMFSFNDSPSGLLPLVGTVREFALTI